VHFLSHWFSLDVVLVYQKKDFDKVLKTLQCIPATAEMVTKSRTEFKKMIDKSDRLAYPLLQWSVISRNKFIRLVSQYS